MGAYTDDRPFSIDLVGAVSSGRARVPLGILVKRLQQVLRQASFTQKMTQIGWTRTWFFETHEDVVALQHAVARYHASVVRIAAFEQAFSERHLRFHRFLDLMSCSPAGFFVPTLDIDLAWHTHQLASAQYNSDCRRYLGRYVDQ